MAAEPILYRVDALVVASTLCLAMFLCARWFYRIGARTAPPEAVELGSIETGVSGLVALLLAFTFSMADTRFAARQHLVVAEANAIGTAFLRCSTLDEPDRTFCRTQLAHYAELRVELFQPDRAPADAERMIEETERIQHALWERVSTATRLHPTTPNTFLMIALNEVIDRHGERLAGYRVIVPQAVTLVMMLACILWSAYVGYANGRRHDPRTLPWLGLAVLASTVIFLTLDLDRPRHGVISTAQAESSMVDLRDALRRELLATQSRDP